MNKLIMIIGLIAGLLTIISFLPQVIKIWKSKKTRDISLWMYIILPSGAFFWITYGIFIKSLPVIITNSIILTLSSTILFFKLKEVLNKEQENE